MLDTNLSLPFLHLVVETVGSLGELGVSSEALMSRAKSLQMSKQKKSKGQGSNHLP